MIKDLLENLGQVIEINRRLGKRWNDGIATTLIDEMKTNSVSLIFSAPYFDERHAIFVSENTGAQVLPVCHQTQARPDTSSYFDMIRHNMETLIQALDR